MCRVLYVVCVSDNTGEHGVCYRKCNEYRELYSTSDKISYVMFKI